MNSESGILIELTKRISQMAEKIYPENPKILKILIQTTKIRQIRKEVVLNIGANTMNLFNFITDTYLPRVWGRVCSVISLFLASSILANAQAATDCTCTQINT